MILFTNYILIIINNIVKIPNAFNWYTPMVKFCFTHSIKSLHDTIFSCKFWKYLLKYLVDIVWFNTHVKKKYIYLEWIEIILYEFDLKQKVGRPSFYWKAQMNLVG